MLEEKLLAMEGNNIIIFEDSDLQVQQLRMPHKFKILKFDKLKGDRCPKMHIKHLRQKVSCGNMDDSS